MAALRFVARKLYERALQRAPVMVEEQQRIFRFSPARRSMASSSFTKNAGPYDALKLQTRQKKEELYRLLEQVNSVPAYSTFAWENIQNYRLTTQLATQVHPKYDERLWRWYRFHRLIFDGFILIVGVDYLYYTTLPQSNEKGDTTGTNKNGEANLPSDGEPKTETT